MNIEKFKKAINFQDPMLCVQGDIFETPADHIAFAVNYPNSEGEYNNSDTGFAAKVCEDHWPELANIKFEKGEIRSHRSMGKTFHAMAVHTNEIGGWKNAPELIRVCLNKLPTSSVEVIAVVLIGGGISGKKWKAGLDNIIGMSQSYKTVVLYIKEKNYYEAALRTGIAFQGIPLELFPKTIKYRAALVA
ncbi:MAG: hypothetical protein WCX80_03880 [Patescibacteria group bacterium]|jgi:hypothetical protein